MIAHKPWSSLVVVLAVSGSLALLFLAAMVTAVVVGYLSVPTGPKTVEVVRYVTVANSALAAPARSAPPACSIPLARSTAPSP